jgi:hypothetical protein
MKPQPQETEKNLGEDLKTFEELPAGTRDLHLLADESEKATGKERADVDSKIKRRAGLAEQ